TSVNFAMLSAHAQASPPSSGGAPVIWTILNLSGKNRSAKAKSPLAMIAIDSVGSILILVNFLSFSEIVPLLIWALLALASGVPTLMGVKSFSLTCTPLMVRGAAAGLTAAASPPSAPGLGAFLSLS